jgi:leucyl-tRNA synthetase
MSKHLGNVVDPDELVASHGADTVRLATLYAARPQKSLNWSDGAVQHCHRFLRQLWDYNQSRLALAPAQAGEMGPDKTEHLRKRLAMWCETAIEKITEDAAALEMHSAVRNVMRLFDRIKDYEKRVLAKRGELCAEDHEALVAALGLLARVLIPFAPHIGEELSIAVTGGEEALDLSWPAGELVTQ